VRQELYRYLWQRAYNAVVRMRPARLLQQHAPDYGEHGERLEMGLLAFILRDRPERVVPVEPPYALNYMP
jgi:hypothetical protein